MGTRLIITESQLMSIRGHLQEISNHESLVEKLVKDLNLNYEPMLGIVRDKGEYFEEPMLRVKADKSEITPKDVYQYFKKKYKLGSDFTKQVIKDWMFGRVKDNKLSKNVAIN